MDTENDERPRVEMWDEPVKDRPKETFEKKAEPEIIRDDRKIEHPAEEKKLKKKRRFNLWKFAVAVLLVLFAASLYTNGFNMGSSAAVVGIGEGVAADKALEFVNDNLLQAGMTAELVSVEEEEGFYLVTLNVNGQDFDSYITMDGKTFFPQGYDIDDFAVQLAEAAEQAAPEMVKSEKPVVELFVMSHCPYGTQIEKGILPVVKLLDDKIDFELKFVYYAMHGETEVMEQLNQYCIQEEQEEKLYDYLECFLTEGDGEGCLVEAGVDETMLDSCAEAVDAEFGITESLEDESSWLSGRFPKFDIYKDDNEAYGIGGSPTLVINGVTVSAGRDSVSLLGAVCDAFVDAPEECNFEFEATMPSPGFGWSTTESDNIASCG